MRLAAILLLNSSVLVRVAQYLATPPLKLERQCRNKRRAPWGPLFSWRPLRRKAEFTGVGDARLCFPPWCLSPNILRSIRESETPSTSPDDFSPRCTPSSRARLFSSAVRKSHFFVIFLSWPGGIKTYTPPDRKILFAGPRWANTGRVLSVRCPEKSTDRHKI
jgi:hypothetical protein